MPLGDQTVGLASGLYRARGLYGRAVALHNWGVLVGQLGQLAAIIATGSLLAVTIAYAATQALTTAYFLSDRCSPPVSIFARGAREAFAVLDYRPVSQGPFAVAGATEFALLNLPVLLVSAFVSDRVAVAQWGLTRVVVGLLRSLCSLALGAAIAIVASDLLIQFGLLGVIIKRQTLQRPFRHVLFLAAVVILVTSAGWAVGTIIRSWVAGTGLMRFASQCTLWLMIVALAASPMLRASFRKRVVAAIPS